MTTQFASGRDSVPAPAIYVTTGGSVMGGSNYYYFWLQARSRCGFNKPSLPFTVAIPDNSVVSAIIPGTSYYASEDWHEFLLYTSTTNDFTTARLIGTYNALQADQKTKTTLGSDTPLSTDPKQLVFSIDNQVNFSSTVANPATLPATPINGARRFITSLSRTYRYSATSTATANGDTVLTASSGRWLFTESNNLIENPTNLTTDTNGCNQNINSIANNPDLILATYDVSGNVGTPIKYYLKSASNTTVAKGTPVVISVRVDSQDVTDDFSGLLDIVIYGKVQTSDYALVTTNFLSAGSVVPYDNNTRNIILEDDLAPNEYLLLSVTPRFSPTDIDTNITPSVGLSLYPYFSTDQSVYAASNITVGDLIFQEYEKRLVIPYGLGDLRVLSGSGCVNLYTWRNKPATVLTGYTTALGGQSVLVSRTGDVSLGTPSAIQLKRASFSTVTGYSTPCNFSTPLVLTAGQTVQYTLQINQDIDGYNPISAIYSDPLLRGLVNKAKLNTNKIAVIVKVDSIYKQFIVTFDPTLTTITGTISDWSSGTVITTGDIADYNKNLFTPLEATHINTGTGGSIPAGSVSVTYSFYYDGTSVSDISHSTQDGCITTQSLSDAELGARYLYWGEGVADITTLRTVEKNGDSAVETRYVASKRHAYFYDSAFMLDDDGDRVIKPNDITGSGRWLADNSNAWFTGTVTPSSTIGDYGDWYLRSDTADLYRKSDTGVWVLSSNIRGLSGTVWRSGSGVPSDSLGIDNDYYLNILNSGVYAKIAGTYVLQGSLSTQITTVTDLTALLAIDVTTITDGVLRVVKNTSIYQYDAIATTGGYAPNVGTGRWFILVGGSGTQIKTTDFTADPSGEYVINSSSDVVIMYNPSLEPLFGTTFSLYACKTATGRINPNLYTGKINGVYSSDRYLSKDKWLKLVYVDSSFGWACPTADVFNGITNGLQSIWKFDGATLIDSQGGRDFVDTGTTPIAYTTGIIGSDALNFNNATADYQLAQSSAGLSPKTVTFTDTLGFAFLVNLTSGTEPIISQKWTSDSTKYTYCVRATDATHIDFSIETGGVGAGVFTATATVAATYGVPLLIVVTMPVEGNVKSPRVMELQINDGAVVTTTITGDYQASDPLIVGQSESGNQIVGVVDQIRSYYVEIDSNQRTLLWNNGAFA